MALEELNVPPAFGHETEEEKLFRILKRPTTQQIQKLAYTQNAFCAAWANIQTINPPTELAHLYIDPNFLIENGWDRDEFILAVAADIKRRHKI